MSRGSLALWLVPVIFFVSLAGLFSIVPHPEQIPPLVVSPTSTPVPSSSPTLIPNPTSTPVPTPTVAPTPKPITPPLPSYYRSISTPKGTFSAAVLDIDLATSKVITDTANDSDCGNSCPVSSLSAFVAKNGGYAGVNGTYFCPSTYPDCSSKTNSFDFPVFNTRLGKWINSYALGWNERRAIFYVDGSGAHYLHSSAGFSGGLSAGIINYPGLLNGGQVQIDDNQSGLSDKQKAKGAKVGIGLRDSQHVLVVVAQNVNMQEFAYVFQSLGATGALNLDTGGSTALINNGKYVFGPGRDLPNAIIFAKK